MVENKMAPDQIIGNIYFSLMEAAEFQPHFSIFGVLAGTNSLIGDKRVITGRIRDIIFSAFGRHGSLPGIMVV